MAIYILESHLVAHSPAMLILQLKFSHIEVVIKIVLIISCLIVQCSILVALHRGSLLICVVQLSSNLLFPFVCSKEA